MTGKGVQISTRFDVEKVKRLRAGAQEARKALLNALPGMKRVAVYLDRWVQTNFKEEGGKVGGWAPFKAGGRYIGGGEFDTSAKLLQDTGALRASFYPFALKDNAGIGSELPYSRTHQDGEGVPQRRMLPNSDEVGDDIRDILAEYTDGVLDNMRDAFKVGAGVFR